MSPNWRKYVLHVFECVHALSIPIICVAVGGESTENATPTISNAILTTSTAPSNFTSALPNPSIIFPDVLPPGGEPPDLIGMDGISGFYGPGTWAGYLMVKTGSWIRCLSKSDNRFDTNTWTYLVFMNWAAGDLIMTVRRLKASLNEQDDAMPPAAYMGSIGAALTIVWWGFFHTLCQMPFCFLSKKSRWQRIIILNVFSILPAAALCEYFSTLNLTIEGYPVSALTLFLYWANSEQYISLPLMASATGIWYLFALICIALGFSFWKLASIRQDQLVLLLTLGWIFSSICCFILYVYQTDHGGNPSLWLLRVTWAPPMLLGYAFVHVLLGPVFIMFSVLLFVVLRALPHMFSPNTCVYMPCTLHKISDTDQSFTLCVGLVLLFGLEISVPLWKRWKKSQTLQEGQELDSLLRERNNTQH